MQFTGYELVAYIGPIHPSKTSLSSAISVVCLKTCNSVDFIAL